MSDLTALIERLESATEGSRELDADVARVCGIEWSHDENGNYGPYDIMPMRVFFTRSIDAAVSLVPEGWGWCSDSLDPGEHYAQAGPFLGEGHTPALALTIAALRARSEDDG